MWNDPELVDPTASPDVKDQHIRDRIRDTVENPTGIFDRSDPGDHRTLYVKKFNNRFGGCSIFVVIVGQDGVITAWKKLDADATDEISGFPDVIRSPGGRIKC